MYLYNRIQIKPLFGDILPWEANEAKNKKQEDINVDILKKKIYLQGLKEGFEKGKYEAEKEAKEKLRKIEEKHKNELKDLLDQTINRLNNVIDNISGLRKEIISKADKDILELSILIAKKIIKTELSQNKEIILNNIREALKNALDRDRIVIKVNPHDYEFLSGINNLKELLDVKEVILKKDESISQGGCIVKTRYSEIDATIESQLRLIEQSIRKEEQR